MITAAAFCSALIGYSTYFKKMPVCQPATPSWSITWTDPTTFEDDTPIESIDGYRILYGTDFNNPDREVLITEQPYIFSDIQVGETIWITIEVIVDDVFSLRSEPIVFAILE